MVAHDKEVHDIAFTRAGTGRDLFASVGSDGYVDLRCGCMLPWYARVCKFKKYQEPEMVGLTPTLIHNGPGQVYGVHILLPTSKEIKPDIRVSGYMLCSICCDVLLGQYYHLAYRLLL